MYAMPTCDVAPVSTTWILLGFAALAVIGLLLILATGRWLFQRGVRIVAPISGFLRRPVVEVLVVLVCVGGFVRYGATKGTNGVDSAASSQASIPAPAFVPLLTPIQAGAGSYGIAADVPPITNLCFAGCPGGRTRRSWGSPGQ